MSGFTSASSKLGELFNQREISINSSISYAINFN